MTIQIDTREKQKAIEKILYAFDREGVKYYSSKLYVGDYMNLDNPRVIIDRKQNLLEVCSNVCQQHRRFIAELERANDLGIKMIILVEHGKQIQRLEDVCFWKNPRLAVSPLAVSGERLYRILSAIQKTYGCEFQFCSKDETGGRIIELL